MVLRVAITDNDWFDLLAARARSGPVEDVNFWLPSGRGFHAISRGELLLFKLHAPRNVIAGGGFFSCFSRISIGRAWETFGVANGVLDLAGLMERVARYRGHWPRPTDEIGCIVLSEPFFFEPPAMIPVPTEFSRHIQTGKNFDTATGAGQRLWQQVQERLAASGWAEAGSSTAQALATPRYGAPSPVRPRLGQGAFRVWVTEAYRRRCAMTGERTLPALEAAHIQPYAAGGVHEPGNGLLLRSDLHRLFDLGYLGLEPESHRILVSDRIRAEFENGRDYYQLRGRQLALPSDPAERPDPARLAYHARHVFQG